MRRILILCISVCFVLCFSSVSLAAVVFGFNQSDLLGLTKYGENPSGQTLSYIAKNPDSIYGSMMGDVGFMGNLLDLTLPISPEIIIGSDSQDLTGYDEFTMILSNDNDDIWTVGLYVDNDDIVTYSGTISLSPDETASLTLDISNFGVVDSIGFLISANRNDTFHISAEAIPEPTMICLFGFGILGLSRRRY